MVPMSRLRVLVPGRAGGTTLILDEPLSFWGGLDATTGRIIDRRHPQCGRSIAGRIVVMPRGRGSSSGSSVLAESIRAGTGPAAILLDEPDEIIVMGVAVAVSLYDRSVPVVLVDRQLRSEIRTGVSVEVITTESPARLRIGTSRDLS